MQNPEQLQETQQFRETKHHKISCLCDYCDPLCRKHLCDRKVSQLSFPKNHSNYNKEYCKKEAIPNQRIIFDQFRQIKNSVNPKSKYIQEFGKKTIEKLQKCRLPDNLHGGGSFFNNTTYQDKFIEKPFIQQRFKMAPIETVPKGLKLSKKVDKLGVYLAPKKVDSIKPRNNLKIGGNFMGDSTYNSFFKKGQLPKRVNSLQQFRNKQTLQPLQGITGGRIYQPDSQYRKDYKAYKQFRCPAIQQKIRRKLI